MYFVNGSDVSAKLRDFQYSSEGGRKQTFSLLRSAFLVAAIVCNLNDREKRNIQNEKQYRKNNRNEINLYVL